MNNISEIVASNLLNIKAVFLRPNEPFTWASGIKSPIYCDNRLTLSYPNVRTIIEEGLAQIIRKYYPTCEVIMGTSTAGIAHAALVANILNLPMGYVRSGAKDHGRKNQIEGVIPQNKNVVVIEDLISTAGSVIEVCDILKEANANVLGIASIFTYELQKGIDNLKNSNYQNHSLSSFSVLINEAVNEKYIKESDLSKLLAFQKDPSSDWCNK